MRALVSASDVVAVLGAHVDKAHDAARRLGCTEDEAFEVTQTAAGELVGDLGTAPETVGDLVGGLYARTRETAGRVRRGGGAPVPLDEEATGSLLGDSEEVRATEQALFDLPERRRLGVLLVDSYALTLPQAAIALGLDAAETARTVALGRLAVVAAVDARTAPSLAGHDVAIGDLGMLADGSAPVGGRFAALRKHVSTCGTCAGVLGVQTRGRGLVGALPVLGLDTEDRTELLAAVGARATATLPSAADVAAELEGDVETPPVIPFAVVALALAAALLLGLGVGYVATRGGSSDVSSSGVVVASSTAAPSTTAAQAAPTTATPTTSAAPTASRATRTTGVAPTSSAAAPPPTTSSAPPTPTVAAAIALSPTSGPTGTGVTVTGQGFPVAALVTISYARPDGTVLYTGSTTTDGDGAFSTTLTASDPPSGGLLGQTSNAGPHTVTASAGRRSASATFDQTS